MAKIYLIRHAESVANTEGRYQGQTLDTHLSNLGKKQVLAMQHRFKKLKFDAVFSSPLLRTTETAQVLGKPVLVRDILETNHGQWEGKTTEEIKQIWPEMYDMWKTTPSKVIFPGGEAFTATFSRANAWLDKLIDKPGTFAVTTHSNIIFALLTRLLKRNLDKMWSFDVQPTSVSLITSNDSRLVIRYYNDTSHLHGLTSDLAKQAI